MYNVPHLTSISEYEKAHKWISEELTFEIGNNVNLFECTIRILGSLLTMYSLTGDVMYKNKAVSRSKGGRVHVYRWCLGCEGRERML